MGERLRRFGYFLRAWPFKAMLLIIFLFFIAYLCRVPLMESAAKYLIRFDGLEKVEVAFVLGGSSMDRGKEAASIYQDGWFPQLVSTGENIPSVLEIKGIMESEAELTKQQLVSAGVHPSICIILNRGTSTMEEAEAILEYCERHGHKKIMIISNKFHLRRIHWVFRSMFKEKGIDIVLHGAASSRYDEYRWWQSEEGLIATNNEYMKLGYYWWKY